MIRVLVVEDSLLETKLISEILGSDPDVTVIAVARDGNEAIAQVEKLRPDLVTMDIHMPKMDGLEATKQIMAYHPTPILVLSSSIFSRGADKAFKAMSYGALDVVEKAFFKGKELDEVWRKEFLEKVKFLSKIKVIPHPLAKLEKGFKHADLPPICAKTSGGMKIVAMVASTGGPQALLEILKSLPKNFPAPLVLVQHIASGFTEGFVKWLSDQTQVKVKMAQQGEALNPGVVYVAPSGLQMRVTPTHKIELKDDPPYDGLQPSGTVLLKSAALAFGNQSLGVVLSGMGKDGAEGLKCIYETKGHTLVQDEMSSVVYGMAKAAMDLGVVHEALPLSEIASRIIKWVGA
ncbi:MAG: chemotaxis-specific protein-glutamate methyltransferase CheB [Chlamydiae bacterium]|nr:chemotaxis-specific protein-glutamate methyltransferase CheB [Chlamydiota bacterium]MBI3266795.1 chemotaxis-specific protein-glutamate methyltransferase CheB [Chlamydiota bacterium]